MDLSFNKERLLIEWAHSANAWCLACTGLVCKGLPTKCTIGRSRNGTMFIDASPKSTGLWCSLCSGMPLTAVRSRCTWYSKASPGRRLFGAVALSLEKDIREELAVFAKTVRDTGGLA